MGGMYAITCKKDYYYTWTQELKNGLDGFANVWVVDFAEMVFYDKYPIYSPSKKHSIEIFSEACSNYNDNEIDVYIVSDGGYLYLWGDFSDDKTILQILIQNWEITDKKIFYEMYDRTISILEKIKTDSPPPWTWKQGLLLLFILFLFSLGFAIFVVVYCLGN